MVTESGVVSSIPRSHPRLRPDFQLFFNSVRDLIPDSPPVDSYRLSCDATDFAVELDPAWLTGRSKENILHD